MIIPAISAKHRIIRHFQDNKATSAEKARSIKDLKIRRNLIFRRLIREGIVKSTQDDKYYLDLKAFESVSAQKRRFVIFLLFIMLIAFLIIFLYSYYSSK